MVSEGSHLKGAKFGSHSFAPVNLVILAKKSESETAPTASSQPQALANPRLTARLQRTSSLVLLIASDAALERCSALKIELAGSSIWKDNNADTKTAKYKA